MKKITIITAVSVVVAGIGVFWIGSNEPRASNSGRLSGEDALGRSYEVSAFSAMIDEDIEATIIKSKSNTLRFERERLLIDGYVCADIASDMKNFNILFTEHSVSVTADGIEIFKRSRENPDLAGLSF
jgi:hypothetical protein